MTNTVQPKPTSLLKPSNETPEQLNELRVNVEAWLKKAQEAVWTFHCPDGDLKGTFLKDSSDEKGKKLSSTTTARCYMALVYADRQIGPSENPAQVNWHESLDDCFHTLGLKLKRGQILERAQTGGTPEKLNNFELAHVVDFIFAKKFCERFPLDRTDDGSRKLKFELFGKTSRKAKLISLLETRLTCADHIKDGQVFFDLKKPESRHFFVTLHTLRGLSILEPVPSKESEISKKIASIVTNARQFCVEQCFYVHQKMRHQQDPARLVFAALIYCMYAEEVDRDIMALLLVNQLVGLKNLINNSRKPIKLGTHWLLLAAVSRWH